VISAYLRLARLPNVFTSMADVLAGLALARGGRIALTDLLLVGASGLLYPAGMVLNDFFDRHLDAAERPERPIPSGQVSARAAGLLGFALLAAGVGVAAMAGLPSLLTAVALAAAIVLYDAVAKATIAGPFVMGACRALNVGLGLSVSGLARLGGAGLTVADISATGSAATLRTLPLAALLLPLGLGLYTALLTLLARDEVHGGPLGRVRALAGGMAALAVGYVVLLAAGSPAGFTPPALIFYAYLLVRGALNFAPAWASSEGRVVGPSIGGGILLMPVIDAAAVAAAGHPLIAVAVFALGVPAQLLRRRFAMS
jgi:4-hydroxybenzoate polyprenyltransferase